MLQIIKCLIGGRVLFEATLSAEFEGKSESVRLGAAVKLAYAAKADLRGADLRGAYLGGADLGGADLGGAYLGGADLGGAYLGGAYLGGAYLRGADLGGKKLIGDRPVFILGPIGRGARYITAYITDAGVYVQAGCFFGTVMELAAEAQRIYGPEQKEHETEYLFAVAMIRAHAELWTPKE